jgi:hypothetical protein
MASDLAQSSNPEIVGASQTIAGGRKDLGHWANTLADSLPGGAAQSLVRGVQTGVLEDIRGGLDGRQQVAVEYGVGALVGGITRFVFEREVVDAAHSAFSDAPDTFPAYLEVPAKPAKADNEPNRALAALEDAAKAVGAGVSTGAVAVRTGVASAADVVTRPFRSVDLDGDGGERRDAHASAHLPKPIVETRAHSEISRWIQPKNHDEEPPLSAQIPRSEPANRQATAPRTNRPGSGDKTQVHHAPCPVVIIREHAGVS